MRIELLVLVLTIVAGLGGFALKMLLDQGKAITVHDGKFTLLTEILQRMEKIISDNHEEVKELREEFDELRVDHAARTGSEENPHQKKTVRRLRGRTGR